MCCLCTIQLSWEWNLLNNIARAFVTTIWCDWLSPFPCHCFAAGDSWTRADFQNLCQSTSVFNFILTLQPRLWRPHDLHATALPFSKIDLPILQAGFITRLNTATHTNRSLCFMDVSSSSAGTPRGMRRYKNNSHLPSQYHGTRNFANIKRETD
jgi:hypothetical protein